VWSPLLGGWLSGRYKREMGGPPSNSRVEEAGKQGWSETWEAYGKESTWKVLDVLFAVAEETGRSPAQAALNWLLNRPGVTCPIIGARKIDHLKDNLGSVDFALDETQMKRLNDASEVVKPYPYDFIGGASSRR
jgi:aryl-alcohol dehydrogenase-like predicted oxidoreductase